MALLETRVTSQPLVFSRPAPFPGCAECRQLDDEWVLKTTPGTADASRATDIVVLMTRHKREAHGGQQ